MIIYCDGACSGNPGPGGFGVVVYDDNNHIIDCYQEFYEHTTNNRMELSAILYALNKYNNYNIIYTDSSYCYNTLTNWMFGWERKGWIKSDKKTPENLDLIKQLFEFKDIKLQLIKGHNNIEGNEYADKLATGKIKCEDLLNGKN